MKQKNRKHRRLWWIAAASAGLLAVLLLAVFIVGNGGSSAFCDNVDTLTAAPPTGEVGELSFADDGSAVLRLYKNDLYLLAEENGVLPGLRREVRERFGRCEFGFRLLDGKMRICVSRRVLGFVPVSMQAVTAVSWDGTGVIVHAERVLLGSRTELPASMWPRSVREDFRIDLAATGHTQEIADVYLEGTAAVVETVPLRLPASDSLHADVQLLEEIRFFGSDAKTTAAAELLQRLAAGDIPTEEELPAESRAELIARLFALQTPDAGSDAMFAGFFARRSERIREDVEEILAEEETKYVKLLTSVREQYKSGALRVEKGGIFVVATNAVFDPFTPSELSAAAADSRVVLLTSGSGTPEVSPGDAPVIKSVAARARDSLEGLDPEHAYDIGAVLTTDGGVPVLLYRRANGEIVMRELSPERYVDILVSGGRPLVNVDTLPEAAAELVCTGCRVLPLR